MSNIQNISRRNVLKSGAAGGVLVLGVTLTGCGNSTPISAASTKPVASGPPLDINLFVGIDDAGAVRIMCHRAEMGQHAKTGMARVIADELDADWERVKVEHSDGDAKWGDQNTDGSTTIRADFTRLRRIGASARSMLRRAAAQTWDVPLEECSAVFHEVVHEPSGRKLGYGELAAVAATFEPPAYEGENADADAASVYSLKDPSEWRYIGKAASSVDLDDIVTGKATYGQDLSLPGMKYAVIARPPVVGGKPTSFNADDVKAISGVIDVFELPATPSRGLFVPLGGIAIIAEDTWAAIEGRNALTVEWEDGGNAAYDSSSYREKLEASVREPQFPIRSKGDVDAAFASAAQTITADYYVPHLSHAQMEPPAALATWEGDNVSVWTCSQNLQQARQDLAATMGIDYANVSVKNALLGGGFGRKSKCDFILEAAILSKQIGAPVKVVWTREDDIHHDYVHTVTAQRLEASLDENGSVTGWRHRSTFPSIASTFDPRVEQGMPLEVSQGLMDNPFDIPNMQVENGKAKGMTRIGWLRSVCNIQHAFAVQAFAAELAHAAGRDPKDYLLELVGEDRIIDINAEGITEGIAYANYDADYNEHPIDTGRLKNVLNIAADKIGWRTDMPAGKGMGIAVHRSFLTYVATALEVDVTEDGTFSIPRVEIACDCGIAANPESVVAQMEGGSLYGLSNTLESAVTFTAGRVDQSNFHDFRVLRMPDAPREVNVTLVESTAPPGGVGEPGTPPFAPALANAIFAATGKRIRSLPIGDQLRS